jgi:histone deacetylase HOS3
MPFCRRSLTDHQFLMSDSHYSPVTIFLQDACLRHQFIRSKDTSNVVERPERLRAVALGVAAAIARCEEVVQPQVAENNQEIPLKRIPSTEQDLATAMKRLDIGSKSLFSIPSLPLQVHKSTASLDVLNHAAVKFVHGDIEGDVYLENLIRWTKESREKITSHGTEIPEGLSEGDLYCME